MAYTYAQRKRPQGPNEPAAEHSAPGPDLNALMAGTAKPSAAQKGRPIEMDAAIKAKMEHAFGDLSSVKLYESPTVGQAGAEAMAMGSEIAFAPGLADFSTREGQARLGHELSHVAARRSGAAPQRSGFLNDRALEARADREGAMAAAGQQVYSGLVTGALSGAAPSSAAAAPMQAKRRDADAQEVKEMKSRNESINDTYATSDYAGYADLNPEEWEEKTHEPGFTKVFGKKNQSYKVRKKLAKPEDTGYRRFANTPELNPLNMRSQNRNFPISEFGGFGIADHYRKAMDKYVPDSVREGRQDLYDKITTKLSGPEYNTFMGTPHNSDNTVRLDQSGGERMIKDLWGSRSEDMSDEELETLFENMYAPDKKELQGPDADPDKVAAADEKFDSAMRQLKGIYYKQLKRLEATYGTLPSQMHPEDFIKQAGPEFMEQAIGQDWSIFMKKGAKYFNDDDEQDQEFKRLANYYKKSAIQLNRYASLQNNPQFLQEVGGYQNAMNEENRVDPALEEGIAGPSMTAKQQLRYNRDLKDRADKEGWGHKLFGRFLNRSAPKLTKAQKKAKEDVDRLFRIQKGDDAEQILHQQGKLVSKEDADWYDKFSQKSGNLTPELVNELMTRKVDAAKKMVQRRKKMGKDSPDVDAGKLDLIASMTEGGSDSEVYERIIQNLGYDMNDDPAIDNFKQMGVDWGLNHPETHKVLQQAENISKSAGNKNVERSPYMRTDEGQAHYQELLEESAQEGLAFYNTGKYPSAPAPKKENGRKSERILNEPPKINLIQEDEPLENNFLEKDRPRPSGSSQSSVSYLNIENEKKDLIDEEEPSFLEKLPDIDDDAFDHDDRDRRSNHSEDFELLNSQKGSDEERRKAYDNIAVPTAQNMTNEQRESTTQYILGSMDINAYLRGQKDHIHYPKPERIPQTEKMIDNISQGIQNNPLQKNLTTYRGITDKFLAMILQQNGLGKAINKKNGTVDHKWLNKNQKKLKKALIGKTFQDKAFTSTSTENKFARKWAQRTSVRESMELVDDDEYMRLKSLEDTNPDLIPGAHLMTINLPKGSKGAFVDRTADEIQSRHGQLNQREVLLDKGSMFRINDIRKMDNADSYELVMELLAEEEGKKKNGGGKKKGLQTIPEEEDLKDEDLLNQSMIAKPVKKKKKKK